MLVSANNDTFYAAIRFEEREALKRAGWSWSIPRKRWETKTAAKAEAFEPFMDQSAKFLLEQWRAKEGASLKLSAASDLDVDLPAPEGKSYLPYQRAGIAYMLPRRNVLVADPPGLGKTIEAIGWLNAIDAPVRRVLIIPPASLKVNWVREWQRWSVHKTLTIGCAGTYTEIYKDENDKRRTRSANSWPDTDVVVVNYDVLDRFEDTIRGATWDALIVDEAHYLANKDAKRTQQVLGYLKKIGQRWTWKVKPIPAERRAFLTGTPMLGRPEQMFSLIRACDPEGLGRNWMDFVYRYCGAHDSGFGLDTSGASNLDELQRIMRERFMVRRDKREVLKELPDKRREIVMLPRDGLVKYADREVAAYQRVGDMLLRYEALLKGQDPDEAVHVMETSGSLAEALSAALEGQLGKVEKALTFDDFEDALAALKSGVPGMAEAFEELAVARRELAIAKLPMVVQQAKGILNAGEKLVLFGVHKDVCRALRDAFPGCSYITGETLSHKRQPQVDRFQEDDSVRIIIGNITAMGVGFTLTASSHVDFAELHWVPTDMEQAEDRVWRIGQKNAVLTRHFAVEGTMDSRMVEVFIKKMEVISEALDMKKESESR